MAKRIGKTAMVAAIYVVLTLAVSPVAFGPLQLRLGEILKPLALGGPIYIQGLSLGLFIANLFSPFAGWWELLFMPISCFVGGWTFYKLRHYPWLATIGYALWISISVGTTLHYAAGLPWMATSLSIALSEVPLFLVGYPLTLKLQKWVKD